LEAAGLRSIVANAWRPSVSREGGVWRPASNSETFGQPGGRGLEPRPTARPSVSREGGVRRPAPNEDALSRSERRLWGVVWRPARNTVLQAFQVRGGGFD
jgi:hypothetical protein